METWYNNRVYSGDFMREKGSIINKIKTFLNIQRKRKKKKQEELEEKKKKEIQKYSRLKIISLTILGLFLGLFEPKKKKEQKIKKIEKELIQVSKKLDSVVEKESLSTIKKRVTEIKKEVSQIPILDPKKKKETKKMIQIIDQKINQKQTELEKQDNKKEVRKEIPKEIKNEKHKKGKEKKNIKKHPTSLKKKIKTGAKIVRGLSLHAAGAATKEIVDGIYFRKDNTSTTKKENNQSRTTIKKENHDSDFTTENDNHLSNSVSQEDTMNVTAEENNQSNSLSKNDINSDTIKQETINLTLKNSSSKVVEEKKGKKEIPPQKQESKREKQDKDQNEEQIQKEIKMDATNCLSLVDRYLLKQNNEIERFQKEIEYLNVIPKQQKILTKIRLIVTTIIRLTISLVPIKLFKNKFFGCLTSAILINIQIKKVKKIIQMDSTKIQIESYKKIIEEVEEKQDMLWKAKEINVNSLLEISEIEQEILEKYSMYYNETVSNLLKQIQEMKEKLVLQNIEIEEKIEDSKQIQTVQKQKIKEITSA